MPFWLLLLLAVLLAVAARLLGLTEELDNLSDACLVVLAALYGVHVVRRKERQP